jgi:dihydrofolate reductase
MISIVVATGKNQEIGKKNGLLWHIPEELKHFKELTMGHPIIMGRKTYESIGRPLPGRTNIVLSRQRTSGVRKAVREARSLTEAFRIAERNTGGNEIFVIGGASVFRQALPFADKLYLTIVEAEFPEADAFFPDYSQFDKILSQKKLKTGKHTLVYYQLARSSIPELEKKGAPRGT